MCSPFIEEPACTGSAVLRAARCILLRLRIGTNRQRLKRNSAKNLPTFRVVDHNFFPLGLYGQITLHSVANLGAWIDAVRGLEEA